MTQGNFKRFDFESLGKLAAAIQALVVSIGIVVGGAYALYTFLALHSAEVANEELAKLRNSLLDLRIEATQDSMGSGQETYVRVVVSAENKGNRPIKLRLKDTPPLWLAKVAAFGTPEDPNLSLDRPIKSFIRIGPDNDDIIGEQIIRPTETYRYPGVFRVRDKGVYLVVFEATVQDENNNVLRAQRWLASTYMTVH
jgi:hypothetical protein